MRLIVSRTSVPAVKFQLDLLAVSSYPGTVRNTVQAVQPNYYQPLVRHAPCVLRLASDHN